MPVVRIPPTLRAEVGGARELEADGSTVAEVIDNLVERYPPLGAQLLQDGELATFVNVYVGGEDVRTRDGLDTEVDAGDQLILLPAMAGGAFLDDTGYRGAEPGSAGV
jgi:molybdopterin converting factor small subunit